MRLDVVRALTDAGIGCSVLMAPVIPFLGDRPEQLRATVAAVADAGAASVTPLVLHLRPGAREWYLHWLGQHHPHLVERYERMYADGAYAPTWYQRRITRQVHELADEFGIGPAHRGEARRIGPAPAAGHLTGAGPHPADPAVRPHGGVRETARRADGVTVRATRAEQGLVRGYSGSMRRGPVIPRRVPSPREAP